MLFSWYEFLDCSSVRARVHIRTICCSLYIHTLVSGLGFTFILFVFHSIYTLSGKWSRVHICTIYCSLYIHTLVSGQGFTFVLFVGKQGYKYEQLDYKSKVSECRSNVKDIFALLAWNVLTSPLFFCTVLRIHLILMQTRILDPHWKNMDPDPDLERIFIYWIFLTEINFQICCCFFPLIFNLKVNEPFRNFYNLSFFKSSDLGLGVKVFFAFLVDILPLGSRSVDPDPGSQNIPDPKHWFCSIKSDVTSMKPLLK